MKRDARESDSLTFARRVLIATLVVASVMLLVMFAWYAADLLMLVFAGVLGSAGSESSDAEPTGGSGDA